MGGSRAAAGGFTSICCMPNTKPVNDSALVTSYIVERARNRAVVNVFPIGAITKGSGGEELAAIGAMKAAGAGAISDDGLPVMNARVMRRAMEFARSYDLPIIQHRSEEHTSELQSLRHLVCRLLLANPIRSEEHTSELQSLRHLDCSLVPTPF